MTNDDEHAVVGRKYLEREAAQAELNRLAKKSLCMEETLRDAADALKARRTGEGDVQVSREIPTSQMIMELLDQQSASGETIRRIDTFFRSRGNVAAP